MTNATFEILKRLTPCVLGAVLGAQAAFGVTVSSDTTVGAADLATYTGADAIVINEGATLTFSGITSAFTLSAPISGAGTCAATSCKKLTLSGNNADFTGAFAFTDTPVDVVQVSALGAASVTFTASAAKVALTQLESGTCANNLTFISGTADKYAQYFIAAGKTVAHTGVVKLRPLVEKSRVELGGNSYTGTMLFSGTLEREDNKYQVYLYTPVKLEPGVTLVNLKGSTCFYVNSGSHLWLDTDVAGKFSSGIAVVKGQVDFGIVDAYTSGELSCGSSSSPYGVVDFHGKDQTLQMVTVPKGGSGKESSNNFCFTTDDPATLTIRGALSTSGAASGSAAYARLNGHLSLVCGTDAAAATCLLDNYGTKSSETDGSLVAYNGTVTLADGAQLPNLSALVVTNTGSVSVSAGASVNPDCELWLSGTGKLTLASGQSLSTAHCRYVDGEGVVHYLPAGYYENGDFGAAGTWIEGAGSLLVKEGAPVVPVVVKDFHWNGSAGTDIATAGNWDESDLVLDNASARLHFNVGTAEAAVNAAASVNAVEIGRAGNFTLGGTAELMLGEGALTVTNAAPETPAEVAINAPLTANSHGQTWTVGAGVQATFSGAISTLMTSEPLTFAGTAAAANNEVVLAGDNVGVKADLVFTNVTKVTVKSDTGLGGGAAATLYDVMPHFVGCTSNGVDLTVVKLSHDDGLDFCSNDAGNVFVQTGAFSFTARDKTGSGAAARPAINLNGQDVTFAGGVTIGTCDRALFNISGARMRIKNKSMSGTQIRLDGVETADSLVYLAAPLLCKTYLCRATIVCEAVNVLPPSNDLMMSASSRGADSTKRSGVIDLNGFDQELGVLSDDYVYPTHSSFGAKKAYFEVRSATPATLSLTKLEGARTVAVKFTGVAALDYAQTGTITLTNAVSTTTGGLTVRKGKLVFAKDAGWRGSTNVMVAAGGTLGVTAEAMAEVFAEIDRPTRSRVALALNSTTEDSVTTYGRLELGAGEATVNTLAFDGVYQAAGTYGSSVSSAQFKDDNRFAGTGVLRVRHAEPGPYGMSIIFR